MSGPGETRLGFLGAGKMAEAMVRALLAAGTPPGRIRAGEISPERRAAFRAATGVEALADNARVAEESGLVVLAVKPQQAAALLAEVGGRLGPARLVLSIMAGWPTAKIAARLPPGARVVRAMPNTPLMVGRGAVGLSAGVGARPGDREAAAAVFAGAGRVFVVPEELLDAVTAVSGSGPAYFFAFLETLAEAGAALGLPRETAAALARETLAGAQALLEQTGADPAVLREQVTSPGGTTAAALRVLGEEGVLAGFQKAVAAAAARSRELGEGGK